MKHNRIKITDVTVFTGRNIYSHRPVVRMTVDIGCYGNIPTNRIPGFKQRLVRSFPGLKTNCCSLGYPGGFLERLREGTYLAHVLEHVVLEMQARLGYDVRFGKTRTVQEPSLYYLVYEYENEVCALECGKAAVVILNHLLEGESFSVSGHLRYLQRISREAELGPSTQAIVDEAKRRGIPVTRIGNGSLIRLGYGRYSRLAEATLTDATSCIAADISCNKQLTKHLLSEHKVPVPYGKVVYSELTAQMAACQIGLPVVIKPFDGNQGKGVHLNLSSIREIRDAFRDAAKYSSGIIVEQYTPGQDYRVLVVGGQVRAVAQRIPARVTGDGVHTVRELVRLCNQDPLRGASHEKPLTRLRLDQIALHLLAKNGLTPDSVPAQGRHVLLRENGNLSTGGTAVDCTNLIHPDNAELAVLAAGTVGIDIAGVDIVTPDISRSMREEGGVVVEVNSAPGIRMHLYPSVGEPRNVARHIVDFLFPDEMAVRFPIVSVTGTNGKTTVARLIQHTLMEAGLTVGLTSTSGTFINRKCICRGDNSGPRSARALLSDRSIQAAVLETARGGLVREGLGYDLASVGIITNIAEDHLGQDGIDSLEDLIQVKSLVAEAIRRDGFAVLNADDPSTPRILERVLCRPILFSKSETTASALRTDCTRIFVDQGVLCLREGTSLTRLLPVTDIPVTWGGLIACNVDNALAAAAGLHALGLSPEQICAGLSSFTENTGRFQLFSLDGFLVLLDYGHNAAGCARAVEAGKLLGAKRMVGVIGMPGDRRDQDFYSLSRLCAGAFQRLFVKEDQELRGRNPGETAGLLRDGLLEEGFPPESLSVITSETQALEHALAEGHPKDLILVFYEKLEPLVALLEHRGAQALQPSPKLLAASLWRQDMV